VFDYAAIYPNSETKLQCWHDSTMFRTSLVKLGKRTLEKALSVVTYPLKLHVKTAKS